MPTEPQVNRDFETTFVDCTLKPADAATERFLDECLASMSYKPSRRYRRGIWSLLVSLYEAQIATADEDHKVVAIPASDSYWNDTQGISRSVVRSFRTALGEAGHLTLRRRNYRDTAFQDSSCDLFDVNLPRIAEYLSNASIITDAPNLFARDKASGKKLNDTDLKTINGIVREGVVKVGTRVAIEGLSRRFSDAKAKRGGRFYGPYTNVSKEDRLGSMTIGGEHVCEVDISNCNLRLLAAWQRHELPDGDLYAGLSHPRDVCKGLLVEMIGAGDPSKANVSKSTRESLSDKGLGVPRNMRPLRDELLAKYPFLSSLKKKVIDSEALAFHESATIARTIIKLWEDHEIVSCPMHDCLIVGESHGELAAQVLEDCFRGYCTDQGWKADVAFEVKVENRSKPL